MSTDPSRYGTRLRIAAVLLSVVAIFSSPADAQTPVVDPHIFQANTFNGQVSNYSLPGIGGPALAGHADPLFFIEQIKSLKESLPFEYYFSRHAVGTDLSSNASLVRHTDFEASGSGGLDFALERVYSSVTAYSMNGEPFVNESRRKMLEYARDALDGVRVATKKEITDAYRPLIFYIAGLWNPYLDLSQGSSDPEILYGRIMAEEWAFVEFRDVMYWEIGVDEAGDFIWPYVPNDMGREWLGRSTHPLKPTNCRPNVGCESYAPAGTVAYGHAMYVVAGKMMEVHAAGMTFIEQLRKLIESELAEIESADVDRSRRAPVLGDGWSFNLPHIRPPVAPVGAGVHPAGPTSGHPGADGIVYFDGYRKRTFGQLTYKEFPEEKAVFKVVSTDEKRHLAQKRGEYGTEWQWEVVPQTGAPSRVQVETFGRVEDIAYRIHRYQRYLYFDTDGRLRYETDYTHNNYIEYTYEAPPGRRLLRITDSAGNTYSFEYSYRGEPGSSGYAYPMCLLAVTSRDGANKAYKIVQYRIRATDQVPIAESMNSTGFERQPGHVLVSVEESAAAGSGGGATNTPPNSHTTTYEYSVERIVSGYLNFAVTFADLHFLATETNPLGGVTRFVYHPPQYQRFRVPVLPSQSIFAQNPQSASEIWVRNPVTVARAYQGNRLVSAHPPIEAIASGSRRFTVLRSDRAEKYDYCLSLSREQWELVRKQVSKAAWPGPSFEAFVENGYDQDDVNSASTGPLRIWNYEHDFYGNVKSITEASVVSKTQVFTYKAGTPQEKLGLPETVVFKDNAGREYRKIEYDYHPLFHESLMGVGGDTRAITYQYQIPSEQDPAGSRKPTVVREIDRQTGRRISTNLWYDERGNLLRTRNAMGHEVEYSFRNDVDAGGRMLRVKETRRTVGGRTLVEAFYTDAFGRPVRIVDAKGQQEDYEYDGFGRLRTAHFADGGSTEFLYGDEPGSSAGRDVTVLRRMVSASPPIYYDLDLQSDQWGNLVRVKRSVGGTGAATLPAETPVTTTFAYDARGRLRRIEKNGDASVTYTHDPLDRVEAVEDFRGGVTQIVYDDRLTLRALDYRLFQQAPQRAYFDATTKTVTDPVGNSTVYYYDAMGRLVTLEAQVAIDYGQNTQQALWRYEWDKRNRLAYVTTPTGVRTEQVFDDMDRLREVRIADGITSIAERFDAYNDLHQWTRYIDSNGKSSGYEYDELDRLKVIMFGDKKQAVFTYDDNDNIAGIELDGRVHRYTYDSRNQVATMADPSDNRSTLTYDLLGRLSAIANPYGKTRRWALNSRSLLASFTDEDGNEHRWRYNGYGGLEWSQAPLGEATERTYKTNKSGDIVWVGNKKNEVWTYERDAGGRVRKVENENLHIAYGFDYGPNGAVKSMRVADGSAWTYDYDVSGRFVGVRSPEGRTEELVYDSFGRVAKQFRAGQLYRGYSYDKNGNIIGVFNAGGKEVEYVYDDLNRVKEVVPYGNPGYDDYVRENGVRPRIRLDYDDAGGKILVTDIEGERTLIESNKSGAVTRIVDPEGTAIFLGRDKIGRIDRLLSFTDGTIADPANPGGSPYDSRQYHLERYAYTPAGQLESISFGDDASLSFGYDANGNVNQRIDEEHRTSTIENDPVSNLPMRVTGPDNVVRSIQRDPLGRAIWTDANGSGVRFSYDDLNRTVDVIQTSGRSHRYTYGRDRYLQEIRLPDPSTAPTSFAYDDRGRLWRVRSASGDMTEYLYDQTGRYTGMQVNGEQVGETIAYNVDGSISTMGDVGANADHRYNYNGTLRGVSYRDGSSIKYDYFDNGMVRQVAYSNGVTKNFAYDASRKVTRVTEGTNSVSLIRDARGRVVEEIHEPGNEERRVKRSADGAITRLENAQYVYDGATGVLDHIKIEGGDGRLLFKLQYKYYPNGWLREVSTPQGYSREMKYDADGRIIELRVNADKYLIKYNTNGNPWIVEARIGGRTRKDEYRYDADGRLWFINPGTPEEIEYGYDARGNLVYERDAALGIKRIRNYTESNQLVEIDDQNGQWLARLGYDGRGNMLKIEYPDGRSLRFEYDGNHRLRYTRLVSSGGREELRESLSYDPLDRLVAYRDMSASMDLRLTYFGDLPIEMGDGQGQRQLVVPGPKNGLPLAFTQVGGAGGASIPTWVLGVGASVHDERGALTAETSRLPYGDRFERDSRPNPFAFKGYPQLSGYGLYWTATRTYDAGLKQFLSPDMFPGNRVAPLSMNRRHVFASNPVQFMDFMGLQDVQTQRFEFPPVVIEGRRPQTPRIEMRGYPRDLPAAFTGPVFPGLPPSFNLPDPTAFHTMFDVSIPAAPSGANATLPVPVDQKDIVSWQLPIAPREGQFGPWQGTSSADIFENGACSPEGCFGFDPTSALTGLDPLGQSRLPAPPLPVSPVTGPRQLPSPLSEAPVEYVFRGVETEVEATFGLFDPISQSGFGKSYVISGAEGPLFKGEDVAGVIQIERVADYDALVFGAFVGATYWKTEEPVNPAWIDFGNGAWLTGERSQLRIPTRVHGIQPRFNKDGPEFDIKIGAGLAVRLRVSHDKVRLGVGLGGGLSFVVARRGFVSTRISTAPERRETFGSWDADDIVRGGRK